MSVHVLRNMALHNQAQGCWSDREGAYVRILEAMYGRLKTAILHVFWVLTRVDRLPGSLLSDSLPQRRTNLGPPYPTMTVAGVQLQSRRP